MKMLPASLNILMDVLKDTSVPMTMKLVSVIRLVREDVKIVMSKEMENASITYCYNVGAGSEPLPDCSYFRILLFKNNGICFMHCLNQLTYDLVICVTFGTYLL